LLKDNADDIRQKVEHFSRVAILDRIEKEAEMITRKYAPNTMGFEPKKISYEKLPELCSAVFIALHGRPGEDGAVQKHLEEVGLPYNGSGIESSQITINKFETNRILREKGFLVADSALITRESWTEKETTVLGNLSFPLIAKPADEGCSSAVVKLKNESMLRAYADLTFRASVEKNPELCAILNIDVKDEFPQKDYFLLEDFIDREGALHFLEITGGMLTKYDVSGEQTYQIFEASEALAEGEILSLAEKFLAGEGQNITPARYAINPKDAAAISAQVKAVFEAVARTLNVQGYCRIDAFVRIFEQSKVDVIIIEINSLPGMTPATCIYHQAAMEGMKPYEFIDSILTFGMQRQQLKFGQA
jgi:D-alanine-D-alanine ligase